MGNDSKPIVDTFSSNLAAVKAHLHEARLTAHKTDQPYDHILESTNRQLQQLAVSFGQLESNAKKLAWQFTQLEQLAQASALLTASLDVEQTFEHVIDLIIRVAGAERVFLLVRDKRTKKLEMRASRDWNDEEINNDQATLSRSIVDKAIAEREPIVTTDAQADIRFAQQESIIFNELRSIICIPLLDGENLIGVLYADNRMTSDVFKENLVPLLVVLASQVANAIVNAEQHQRVKDDLEQAQRQLEQLSVTIDQSKIDNEVAEIAKTDYFQYLEDAAKRLRDSIKDA